MKGRKKAVKWIGVLMAGFIGAGTAIGAAGMADTANVFAQDAQNTEYTVTFKNKGQGNVPDALKVASGKTIARAVNYDAKKLRPAVTVIDGYKFDDSGASWGLYTDEACTKAFDVFNTPITKNTTLYVKWVPVQTHKITFKANGVTADPPAIVVEGGVTRDLELPFEYDGVVNGKMFYGWYTDPGLSQYFERYNYKVENDLTLYAKWYDTHKVSFNMNGHGTAPEPVYSYESGNVYLPDEIDVIGEAGWVFTGWYKDAACTQVFTDSSYGNGDKVNSDTVLYAGWRKATTHKITFNMNGHGEQIAARYVEHGGNFGGDDYYYALRHIQPYPMEEGYEFDGWYHDPECTQGAGDSLENVTKDITLYAAWISETDICTITFDGNGHGGVLGKTTTKKGDIIHRTYDFKPDDLNNLKFAGWSIDKVNEINENMRPTEDITLYALWEPVTNYKVTFINNGRGEDIGVRYYEKLDEYYGLPYPWDSGYSFEGWYEDSALTKPVSYRTLTKDITLYAKWEKREEWVARDVVLTLNYNGNGGTTEKRNVKAGSDIYRKDLPFIEGQVVNNKIFRGWYKDPDFQEGISWSLWINGDASDLTIYAKWEDMASGEETCTISFDTKGITTPPADIKVAKGTSYYDLYIAAPEPSEINGHKFSRWSWSGEDYNSEIDQDIVLTAEWDDLVNTVSLMLDSPKSGEMSKGNGHMGNIFKTSIPNNPKFKVGAVWDGAWTGIYSSGGWLKNNKEVFDDYIIFDCGNEYTAEVFLTPENGYYFDETTKVFINGKEAKFTFDRDSENNEGQLITAEVTFSLTHDWGEWIITKQPTYTEEGSKKRVCKNDPDHTEVQSIPKSEANTVAVTGVTLDKTNAELTEGESVKLTATVSPADATDKGVTFTSSNTGVATVDANGNVKAVKPGTATITVKTKDGGKTAKCTVTVKAKTISPSSVKIEKKIYVMNKGATSTIKATVEPANAENKTVTWSSSNTNVATVDASGNVKAINHGTAKITAKTSNGKTAECEVRVNADTFTGVRKDAGQLKRFRSGAVDTAYTGVDKYPEDGKWYYFEKGIHNPGFTGIAKSSKGNWIFVKDGVYDAAFTGIAKSTKGNWLYAKNGRYDTSYTGVAKSTKGNWLYVTGGRWDTKFTGAAKATDGRWLYVKDGRHDSTFTGAAKSTKGNWIYVNKGVYTTGYSGVTKATDGKWLYMKNGRHEPGFTGVAKSDKGNWIYVKNGVYDTSFTGVAKSTKGNWIYVKNGRYDASFTGIAQSTKGNKLYIVKGRWQNTYIGKYQNYNIKNGYVI